MSIPALLDELLRAPGPPGSEGAVAEIVRRETSAFADVEGDVLGSTIARVRGTAGGRTLALFAHVDQVGMIVTHVEERGLLRVAPLGTWSAATAVGQRVRILTRSGELAAVVAREGKGQDVQWAEILLDVGATDGDHARALVRPGDSAVMGGDPLALVGGRIAATGLDDRAGIFAVVEALRRLAADPPPWDVVMVASTQEETGTHGGAMTAAHRIRPDVAIAVEVTYAADEPGRDPGEWGHTWLGAGAAVFRSPVCHPAVSDGLIGAAERDGIPIVVEAGQSSWSDSDDVFVAADGIPTGLVSIPLRYMHSSVEVVQLADLEAVSRLLEAYARLLTIDASFVR